MLFDTLYQNRNDYLSPELAAIYNPPENFEHAKKELVCKLKGDGDGYNVEVYESRWPARFYEIVALPTPNSIGEERPGFRVGTGSSMLEFALQLALHIQEGMIGFYPYEDTP